LEARTWWTTRASSLSRIAQNTCTWKLRTYRPVRALDDFYNAMIPASRTPLAPLASLAPYPALEPEDTGIEFPSAENADDNGVVAVGEDFRAGTILQAYRNGIFPWPHKSRGKHVVLWCSPEERTVFPLEAPIHVSRSLRRTFRRNVFEVTLNTAFEDVIRMCGETRTEGTWIIPQLVQGYCALHRLGFAHSVEVWQGNDEHRQLVGGIYGIAVGHAFAGESMFHLVTDASKIAFYTLAHSLQESGFRVFDAQVENAHLSSLGCVEIPRSEYLNRLSGARVAESSPQLRLPSGLSKIR
jgi:leucyl/phenylalanyl-tRNA---protein transferase